MKAEKVFVTGFEPSLLHCVHRIPREEHYFWIDTQSFIWSQICSGL